MKRIWIYSLVGLLVAIGAVGGVRAWRGYVVARAEARAYDTAGQRLREGRPLEALAVAGEEPRSDARFAWSQLELAALTAARQVPRLVAMYERAPGQVLAHEEASLLIARALMAARQPESVDAVREAWRGREQQPELWLALDSDRLSLEGQPIEAEALLRSRQFRGQGEATRLVRLSLYAARRDLHEAWTLLDQAAALAPRNPDIRSFRAQILETIGKPAEARVEYVAAHVADPSNPMGRDELAEFYRRQGSYDQALKTWRDALGVSAPDFVWLKEAFWSRVIQPAASSPAMPRLAGGLAPLVEWLRALPADRFWDEATFESLPNAVRWRRERAEVFWLPVLEWLRTGRETDASELLERSRIRQRVWQPRLAAALAQVLRFRGGKSLGVPEAGGEGSLTNQHQFFVELDRAARAQATDGGAATVPPDLARWLSSRNAVAGTFLAAGWREAALILTDPEDDAPAPAWFTYGYAQCLRFNRSPAAALTFLEGQAPTPELSVLKGELLLAVGRTADGLRALATQAAHDSDAGFRAAWLLAQAQLERRDYALARDSIHRQPRLARSTVGREQLARAALLEGNQAEADTLYHDIETDSAEARAYLARRAFAQKDWATARRHTEALLRLLPDELQVRENLIAIAKAEQAHAAR